MVERHLAKVNVAGSNPVSRSTGVIFTTLSSISVLTEEWCCPAAPEGLGGGVFCFGATDAFALELAIVSRNAAPYPSGKGEVCKTFMRRFESARRL